LAISKTRKDELVVEYNELLNNSSAIILTSYSGVPVKDLESLRRTIREVGGEFHIVKNTLIELALDNAGLSIPKDMLVGTTAIGFATDDVPNVAKAVVDLSRESGTIAIKGGMIDKILYDPKQIVQLADLPPLPVLRAQLLSQIQAPGTRVALALANSVRQIINVTKAYSESGAAIAA
jgi:large subunit ribosomal protein L10